MSENPSVSTAPAAKPQLLEKIRPTLFISLGGTGMKVSIRLRRRILNAIWAGNERVQLLSDFPAFGVSGPMLSRCATQAVDCQTFPSAKRPHAIPRSA